MSLLLTIALHDSTIAPSHLLPSRTHFDLELKFLRPLHILFSQYEVIFAAIFELCTEHLTFVDRPVWFHSTLCKVWWQIWI